jgi:hypothetical protein
LVAVWTILTSANFLVIENGVSLLLTQKHNIAHILGPFWYVQPVGAFLRSILIVSSLHECYRWPRPLFQGLCSQQFWMYFFCSPVQAIPQTHFSPLISLLYLQVMKCLITWCSKFFSVLSLLFMGILFQTLIILVLLPVTM